MGASFVNRFVSSPSVRGGAVLGALSSLLAITLGMPLSGCASRSASIEPITITVKDETADIIEARRLALEADVADSPADAIELYRQALTVYRELAPVWNNLGIQLMQQQQYLDAAQAFVNASEIQPEDPRPLYNLGLTWERAGYLIDALRYYGKSLERDPRYLPALRGAIRAERILGRAGDETIRRVRLALAQEQDESWRRWFELQRPQIEAEAYSAGRPQRN